VRLDERGTSIYPADGSDADTLAEADRRMYTVKQQTSQSRGEAVVTEQSVS
jgi:GGDEF domain-containing protein